MTAPYPPERRFRMLKGYLRRPDFKGVMLSREEVAGLVDAMAPLYEKKPEVSEPGTDPRVDATIAVIDGLTRGLTGPAYARVLQHLEQARANLARVAQRST